MESARAPDHITSPVSSNIERDELLVVHFRRLLFLSIILTLGALYQITQLAIDIEVLETSFKWQAFVGLLSLSAVLEVILIIASWTSSLRWLFRFLNNTKHFLHRFRLLNLVAFLALSGVFPLLILGAYGQHLEGYLVRLFLLWSIGLAGGLFLHAYNPERPGTKVCFFPLFFMRLYTGLRSLSLGCQPSPLVLVIQRAAVTISHLCSSRKEFTV